MCLRFSLEARCSRRSSTCSRPPWSSCRSRGAPASARSSAISWPAPIIGPGALRLVTDVETIKEISEFGVLMLLFLVGLELRPRRIWLMRRAVFGLGAGQVVVTGALLAARHRLDLAARRAREPGARRQPGLLLHRDRPADARRARPARRRLGARRLRGAFVPGHGDGAARRARPADRRPFRGGRADLAAGAQGAAPRWR